MNKTDINKLIKYSDDKPHKEIFYDSGGIKTQIMCLKAGQIIPPCKMTNDVLFYVIEGEGEIIVDSKKEELKANVSIVVPCEAESRSIQAKTDMVILGVQSKSKGI
jgi:mannose-6-phosphate isomerase-like protein (cupin superfamily)